MAIIHHYELTIGEDDEHPDLPMTVDLAYVYTKGYPARMYMPNGDPGYPGEDSSVEIISMTVERNGQKLPFRETFPEIYEAYAEADDLEYMILEAHEEE